MCGERRRSRLGDLTDDYGCSFAYARQDEEQESEEDHKQFNSINNIIRALIIDENEQLKTYQEKVLHITKNSNLLLR